MGTEQALFGNGVDLQPEDIDYIEQVVANLNAAEKEIGRAFKGQDKIVQGVLMAMISGGHVLLTGVPGTGKTALSESIGRVFGLEENRIQCTPDLTPMDIIGSEVLEVGEDGKRSFKFIPGPIFTQVLLVDEINRASPRTQAALLQAMQEKKVTIGGRTYELPQPFFLIATQNPIDQEGTNPLPEAQKDRFLMEMEVSFPNRDAEREIMTKTTTTQHTLADLRNKDVKLAPPVNLIVKPKELNQVMDADDLIRIQHLVRMVPLGKKVCENILDVVRSARPNFDGGANGVKLNELFNFVAQNVDYGPGTRALQAFSLLTRAKALMRGGDVILPTVDDVYELAAPIIRHRMDPSPSARTNLEQPNEMALKGFIIDKVVQAHSPG